MELVYGVVAEHVALRADLAQPARETDVLVVMDASLERERERERERELGEAGGCSRAVASFTRL